MLYTLRRIRWEFSKISEYIATSSVPVHPSAHLDVGASPRPQPSKPLSMFFRQLPELHETVHIPSAFRGPPHRSVFLKLPPSCPVPRGRSLPAGGKAARGTRTPTSASRCREPQQRLNKHSRKRASTTTSVEDR